MKKIGIFGGTFSPPHNGHVSAAKCFIETMAPDKLIIMPSNIPPHKYIDTADDPRLRLEMAHLAFDGLLSTVVSDWEISRGDISYTANTLLHFSKEGKLYFLCGTDMFLTLDSWYRPDIIFSNASIVLADRYLAKSNDVESARQHYVQKYGADITILPNSIVEISSSEIRRRIKNSESCSDLLPPSVEEYIKRNGLYK